MTIAKRFPLGVLIVVLIASAIFVVSSTRTEADRAGTAPTPVNPGDAGSPAGRGLPPLQSPVVRVPSNLAADFALFRKPASGAPDQGTDEPTRFGVSTALSRTVDTAVGTVRVSPGDGWICISTQDGDSGSATGCAPEAAARQGKLVLSLRPEVGQPGTVIGLAPDGVTAATAADRSVPVIDNVWSLSDSDAAKARLVGDSGEPVGPAVEIPGSRSGD
jgi:hypothetical protein